MSESLTPARDHFLDDDSRTWQFIHSISTKFLLTPSAVSYIFMGNDKTQTYCDDFRVTVIGVWIGNWFY
jgi:hypothetical protein